MFVRGSQKEVYALGSLSTRESWMSLYWAGGFASLGGSAPLEIQLLVGLGREQLLRKWHGNLGLWD